MVGERGSVGRMIDEDAIRQRWEAVGSRLDERGRRLFAACEVRSAGWGGLATVSRITRLARSTINRGEDDLDAEPLAKGRVRRAGGGRRAVSENDPGLVPALKRLVDPATLGDPMRPLIWVSKSMEKIAAALAISPSRELENRHRNSIADNSVRQATRAEVHLQIARLIMRSLARENVTAV